ncbi:MAG: HyaD/HybD family hydrogenase maturation endopeptidase [Saezia sp.]
MDNQGTLVLGIGNIFLADEAIGVRVVEALEKRFNIPAGLDVIDGGTSGMEMLQDMANRDHIIVVDAVTSKKHAPGSVVILRDQQVPAMFTTKISPHQLGLSDVLSALIMTDEYPKKLTLVGVVPESLEFNQPLTATVQKAFDAALEQVLSFLKEDGYTLTEKAAV